jgi:hypothetical protein
MRERNQYRSTAIATVGCVERKRQHTLARRITAAANWAQSIFRAPMLLVAARRFLAAPRPFRTPATQHGAYNTGARAPDGIQGGGDGGRDPDD